LEKIIACQATKAFEKVQVESIWQSAGFWTCASFGKGQFWVH
jgi:hypothetical protein